MELGHTHDSTFIQIKTKTARLLFLLLTISIGFGNININIGFSIKPYMVVTLLALICSYTVTKMEKLFSFEKILFLYSLFYIFTIAQCRYIQEGLWFSCVFVILIFFYLIFRRIIKYVDLESIEQSIDKSGIIICIASLLYYLLGIYKLGIGLTETGVVKYGVMIDRFIFRLCGTINEPNLVSVYLAPFFSYYLFNFKSNKSCKVGLVLTLITILLTMSRGAFVCLFISMFCCLFLINNKLGKKNIKKFFIGLIIVGGIIVIIFQLNGIDVIEPLYNRFENISTDSGSGRVEIWKKALITFSNNPFIGVGLNGIRSYNIEHYGNQFNIFTHNSYLEVLAESGIIGFMLFIGFWIQLLLVTLKLSRKNNRCNYLVLTVIYIALQIFFLSAQLNEMIFYISLLVYRYASFYHNKTNKLYRIEDSMVLREI